MLTTTCVKLNIFDCFVCPRMKIYMSFCGNHLSMVNFFVFFEQDSQGMKMATRKPVASQSPQIITSSTDKVATVHAAINAFCTALPQYITAALFDSLGPNSIASLRSWMEDEFERFVWNVLCDGCNGGRSPERGIHIVQERIATAPNGECPPPFVQSWSAAQHSPIDAWLHLTRDDRGSHTHNLDADVADEMLFLAHELTQRYGAAHRFPHPKPYAGHLFPHVALPHLCRRWVRGGGGSEGSNLVTQDKKQALAALGHTVLSWYRTWSKAGGRRGPAETSTRLPLHIATPLAAWKKNATATNATVPCKREKRDIHPLNICCDDATPSSFCRALEGVASRSLTSIMGKEAAVGRAVAVSHGILSIAAHRERLGSARGETTAAAPPSRGRGRGRGRVPQRRRRASSSDDDTSSTSSSSSEEEGTDSDSTTSDKSSSGDSNDPIQAIVLRHKAAAARRNIRGPPGRPSHK